MLPKPLYRLIEGLWSGNYYYLFCAGGGLLVEGKIASLAWLLWLIEGDRL